MNIEFRQFHGPSDWGWCNQQVSIKRCEDTTGIMAIDLDTNTTVGAVIFDNWTITSAQCHLMVSTPLVFKHDFFGCIGEYAFNTCGLNSLIGFVPADKEKAVKLNQHLGFKEIARINEGFAVGVDYLIMEFTRDDWRNLVAKNGGKKWLNIKLANN